jgi:bifunctional enzyme CysN/CysC
VPKTRKTEAGWKLCGGTDTCKMRDQLNVVMVGHVDHGKSTVIGRLLADTHSLPEGKLESVKEFCRRNARPFEYAFLLDALKDEQAQGITIDSARCFFKSSQRDYILIDAPGHVEFLKNMITGASRADAAVLVIDAQEGIKENSRRHGYLLSLLGIKQLVVVINKMDLVGRSMAALESLKSEYGAFLQRIGVHPKAYVPVCAREGENIAIRAGWYGGPTVLECLDSFSREVGLSGAHFRLPVQDIYKFTAEGDDRRIVAGTVQSGTLQPGDAVTFFPSQKSSRVKTFERFNGPPPAQAIPAQAIGLTLEDELYLRPGEILCKTSDPAPHTATRFRTTLFWLGRSPLVSHKRYKLKLNSAQAVAELTEVGQVLDASDLSSMKKDWVDRHDVAECIFETTRPVAFDLASELETTARFVIVDQFEIAGAGIILESLPGERIALQDHIQKREQVWEGSTVPTANREARYHHKSKFIAIIGSSENTCRALGSALEKTLFARDFKTYYLGPAGLRSGLDSDMGASFGEWEETIRRLGELARIITDGGLIFISAIPSADMEDVAVLRALNAPHEVLVVDIDNLKVSNDSASLESAVRTVCSQLIRDEIIPDYII